MHKITASPLLLSLLLSGCPESNDPDPAADSGTSPATVGDAGQSGDAQSGDASQRDAGTGPASQNGDAGQNGGPSQGDAGGRPDASQGGDAGGSANADGGGANDAAAAGDDSVLARQNIEKFKACGLYEPSADPVIYTIEDELDRCAATCTLAASCEQIESTTCDGTQNTFRRCLERCPDPPDDGFRCDDGSRIPHAALCDLVDDCADDEDESDCGEFRCADGERVPAATVRCDWIEDCGDGSDESGCAFSCL